MTVPENLPTDLLGAERTLRGLGWITHPLLGPNEGDPKERGKKPRFSGYNRPDYKGLTSDSHAAKFFANGTPSNLGVAVRKPHVIVDLDSKPDNGASVREWLAGQKELESWPREKTGGGVHLHCVCEDSPTLSGGKAEVAISDTVTAEIFVGPHNVVVSPSVHPSGATYEWERKGPLPKVAWKTLVEIFKIPEKKANRGQGMPAFTGNGDWETLDIVALAKDLGIYGQKIGEGRKHSVPCPWRKEHSAGGEWSEQDTDTVILEPDPENGKDLPGFSCLHAHCSDRSLKDFLEWCNTQRAGVVDAHCAKTLDETTSEIPDDVLPAPAGAHNYTAAAEKIFPLIAGENAWFNRNGTVHEIFEEQNKNGGHGVASLRPLTRERAVPSLEEYARKRGKRIARHETGVDKETKKKWSRWRTVTMPVTSMELILNSNAAQRHLPSIVQLLSCPVLAEDGAGGVKILGRGYHAHAGGTYILEGKTPPQVPLEAAVDALVRLHEEFEFCSPSDLSRALGVCLSPALKMGRFIRDDSPMHVAEATESQSGKDYMQKIHSRIYNARPSVIAPARGGTGSLDETISRALIAGRPFICFSNFRGKLDSAVLESAIRGQGRVECRAYRNAATVDVEPFIWQLSTNGAEFTRDIANRSIITRIRKKPEDFTFKEFPEGDLFAHVKANQPFFLGCVFAVVAEWVAHGKPKTKDNRHDFRTWCQSVDWIVQNIFGLAPLLDGHREEQHRTANPALQWLRDVGNAVIKDGMAGQTLSASEIVDVCDEAGIDLPGRKDSKEDAPVRIGRTMKRLFSDRGVEEVDAETARIRVDGIIATRESRTEYDENRRRDVAVHRYSFDQETPPDPGTLRPVRPVRPVGGLDVEKLHEPPSRVAIKGISPQRGARAHVRVEPGRGVPMEHHLITNAERLADVASDLGPAAADGIALDVETYGEDRLDPRRGEIRLLQLQRKDGTPWILDLKTMGYDLGPVGEILSRAVLVIHNAAFDLGFLRAKCGLRADGRIVDALTASRLLTAGTNTANDLGSVLSRHLGVEIPKELGKSDWGGLLLDDQLDYAARDVFYLHDLRQKLRDELTTAGLGRVWDLEEKVLHVVVDLTTAGFAVDVDRLRSIQDRERRRAEECGGEIQRRLGKSFNVASPKQLTAALREVGFSVDATDVETVRSIGDQDLVASIVGYREAEKLAQQAQSLLEASRRGRIHAGYNPTGTDTGRFSCSKPNLQNVARGELRDCFIAPPGRSLVVCDYSQVELRLAAFIAKDERMVETFKDGTDLHTTTASVVLGVPVDQVSKADRQLAKAVNFGLLYGQSAPGLVRYAKSNYGVEITEGRAREIRDKFFCTYAGLARWHKESMAAARRPATTEARTLLGRRRILPDLQSKRGEWGRFTDLVNTPVQGAAADGLKAALVLIHERLPADAFIVSTIHDEVVVECADGEASEVLSTVKESMVEAWENMVDGPVEVEGGTGRTWGGAKG